MMPWSLLLMLRRICAFLGLRCPDEERVYIRVWTRTRFVGDAAALALVLEAYPAQWWASESAPIASVLSVLLTGGHVNAYETVKGRFSIDDDTTEKAQRRALRDANELLEMCTSKRRLAFFRMCTVSDPNLWIKMLRLRPIEPCEEESEALAVATSRGRVLDPLAAIEPDDLFSSARYLYDPCMVDGKDAPAAREWFSQRFGVIVEDVMRVRFREPIVEDILRGVPITEHNKIHRELLRAWEAAPTFPQDLPTGTLVRINGGHLIDTAAPQEKWARGELTISRVDGTASAVIKLLDANRSGDTLCSVRLSAAPTADELLRIAWLAPRLAELNAQDASDAVLRDAAPRLMRDHGLRALSLSKSNVTSETLALYAGLHKIVLDECINDVTGGVGALFGPLEHVELVRTPCQFAALTKTMTYSDRETLRVVRVVGTNPEDGHAALRLLGCSHAKGSNPPRSVCVEETPFVKGFYNAVISSASALNTMSLRGCTTMNATDFHEFANATQGVYDMDASHTSLDDMGLYALQSLQDHQMLDIGHTRVTEDGLRHLGRRRDVSPDESSILSRIDDYFATDPRKLRMLTLDGLPGVTEDVVQGILETHRGLLYLSVRDCVNFAARTAPELVGKLCKGHPLLLLRC